MEELLYELLAQDKDKISSTQPSPQLQDGVTRKYLSRIPTLSVASLTSDESQSLAQATHSNLLALQSLSARSSGVLTSSSSHLSSLQTSLPRVARQASGLQDDIPRLDEAAVAFAEKYSRTTENTLLDRRKNALLLERNVDRLADILDIPTLTSSAISSSTAQGGGTASYANALDLHSHIKRLHLLFPDSELVRDVYRQTEEAMTEMTSNLIASLRAQNIKLAAGMRTVGWLRRVAPDLNGTGANSEGSLGALFLVCRLGTLNSMLEALDPLRDLADQETAQRLTDIKEAVPRKAKAKDAWSGGQQTERYLKRYIEIFREQSFAIISMYRSIFPSAPDIGATEGILSQVKNLGLQSMPAAPTRGHQAQDDPLLPLPSALATFPMHLIHMLSTTLKQYFPNVRDKASRESLMTQILYCAGSLGRLGGDFSLLFATLRDDGEERESDEEDEMEWVMAMKKHRVLAGKLEKLASGGG